MFILWPKFFSQQKNVTFWQKNPSASKNKIQGNELLLTRGFNTLDPRG